MQTDGMPSTILVTGGAGFVGSALCRHLIANSAHRVVCFDKLTYAGSRAAVQAIAGDPRFTPEVGWSPAETFEAGRLALGAPAAA